MTRQPRTSTLAGLILVVLSLLAVGCSGSSDDPNASAERGNRETAAQTDAVTSTAPTATPETPTATPVPEPTTPPADPTPTAVPERDLPLLEAEEVALEFIELTTELFDDPVNMDISRMIQLEAGPDPVQPMTNWTLRAVANLTEENRYQPAGEVVWQVIGSQWDPEQPGLIAWVDICVQTGGVWFDIDSDEAVLSSHPDPFVERFRILTETMQVAAVSEDPEGTGFVSCEFSGNQS